ncbi:MAG: hypothetical protein OXC40_02640 [Proteobacteria bacterium]|nr:hypothetical protein [Pseudomonadota bacterium]
MIILENYTEFPKVLTSLQAKGSVVVVGNFDGCHLGHRSLLTYAQNLCLSSDHRLLLTTLTFQPHPRVFFKTLQEDQLFFNEEQKSQVFASLGVDVHIRQKFNRRFAELSGQDFIQRFLCLALAARHVVVGNDFCFGKNRSFNSEKLKVILEDLGIACHIRNPALFHNKGVISSSLLREYSMAGDMAALRHCLGRPLAITGYSVPGKGLGSKLLYPTANIPLSRDIPIKNGVYQAFVCYGAAVDLLIDPTQLWQKDQPYLRATHSLSGKCIPASTSQTAPYLKIVPALVNKGFSPTLPSVSANKRPHLEVYLLEDPARELRGEFFTVWLLKFMRAEKTFTGLELLRNQVRQDIAAAKAAFASSRNHHELDITKLS